MRSRYLPSRRTGRRSCRSTQHDRHDGDIASQIVIPEKSVKKFQRNLKESFDLAERGQAIVTIGIKPTSPETGYGYIKMGDPLPPPKDRKAYKSTFSVVQQFVEKPNYDRAVEYLNDGGYRWNAGMFIFSFATIAESLFKHQKPRTKPVNAGFTRQRACKA